MLRNPHVVGWWRLLHDRVSEMYRDFGWREASGSVGDLGTFVPLLVGLTVVGLHKLHPGDP
jgi:hypothetical protein